MNHKLRKTFVFFFAKEIVLKSIQTLRWPRATASDYQNNVKSPLGQSERISLADPIGGSGDESPVAAARLHVEGTGEQPAVDVVGEADGEARTDVDERGQTDPL